jgi:hypothetical protein
MGKLARAAFLLAALPLLVRAACRCVFWSGRLPLDALVERLRETRPLAVRWLADPPWLLASVERLLPLLPPWGHGPCLKRSLLLLDLWSRCGLSPRLHLGVRVEGGDRRHGAHAWVTTNGRWPGSAGALPLGTSSNGYPEAFEL